MELKYNTKSGVKEIVLHFGSYSKLRLNFHCKIPNFVGKFAKSFRSSKVYQRNRLVNSEMNFSTSQQIWELRNLVRSESYGEKLAEIDCKNIKQIIINL